MKKLVLVLITVLTVTISFGQIEKLDYCNCQDQIERITPELNGKYERKCNGVIIEKGEFVDGLKNGEWTTYSHSGKLIRKFNFDKGVFDGKVELFYVNGKPKLTGQFKEGSKIGKWTYYTEKGKILCEGSFENNIPVGIWTINDKKGKNTVVQYDYNSMKYIINEPTQFYKDGDVFQNDNTEGWYILSSPNLKYSSKSEPIGGYEFANFMFVNLVEVPENYWDTNLYRKYKVAYKITSDKELSFNSELFTGHLPSDRLELTFLIVTNPASKIKKINHSDLQIKLLDYKINEVLSLMPPWIYNGQSDIEVYLHYVINQNLHRQ